MRPRSAQANDALVAIKGAASLLNERRKDKPVVIRTNPETGEVFKEKSKKNKSEKEKGQASEIQLLFSRWKELILSNSGVAIESPAAFGSDFGHLKHIHKYFCGFGRALEALQTFVSRWKDIQKKFPIARNKDVPSLYLVDTLKQDLEAVMCGKSSLTGDPGGTHRADGQSEVGDSQEDLKAYFKG
jgi:hypothetical protein